MSKDWKKITTINDCTIPAESEYNKQKKNQNFKVCIHNTKSFTLEDLKKHSDGLYNKKSAEDAKLLLAFEEKRLKSKDAIKRAIALKKEQEKADAKKQAKEKKDAGVVQRQDS